MLASHAAVPLRTGQTCTEMQKPAEMADGMSREGPEVAQESIEDLLAKAEDRYRLKIFENICETTVKQRPLPKRLRTVGKAIMERIDYEGYVLGRQLVAAADRMDGHC